MDGDTSENMKGVEGREKGNVILYNGPHGLIFKNLVPRYALVEGGMSLRVGAEVSKSHALLLALSVSWLWLAS